MSTPHGAVTLSAEANLEVSPHSVGLWRITLILASDYRLGIRAWNRSERKWGKLGNLRELDLCSHRAPEVNLGAVRSLFLLQYGL